MVNMTELAEKSQTALTQAVLANVMALLSQVADEKRQGKLGLPS